MSEMVIMDNRTQPPPPKLVEAAARFIFEDGEPINFRFVSVEGLVAHDFCQYVFLTQLLRTDCKGAELIDRA